MNILFLTREYKHQKLPTAGGTGNFVANISKELVKKVHKVYVLEISKKSIDFDADYFEILYKPIRHDIYFNCTLNNWINKLFNS